MKNYIYMTVKYDYTERMYHASAQKFLAHAYQEQDTFSIEVISRSMIRSGLLSQSWVDDISVQSRSRSRHREVVESRGVMNAASAVEKGFVVQYSRFEQTRNPFGNRKISDWHCIH